ncbi:MAG: NAD(P)-dependent glycerol-3-phosphate dehydrogenase [Abditibacteriota bacterium]|nr:NAD(P)-dependent glycerol-3-phosphate dehydrogenase [Abditibacteriota bacterium]
MKVTVLGGGSWGSALSMLISRNGHSVRIWTNEASVCDCINREHKNTYYTKDYLFADTVTATLDMREALEGSECIVMAIPSNAFRSVLTELMTVPGGRDLPFLNAGKGLEASTGLRETQIITQVAGEAFAADAVILSGPNLAMEFVAGKPGCTVLAGKNEKNTRFFQKLLSSDLLRAYTTDDVIGVEAGGSLKNILAIACGISAGMGFGDNTKAAIQTRGLGEITRLGVCLGGRKETFYGLSGLGDMITTSSSILSRNFRLGIMLAEGLSLDEAREKLGQVAEGVPSCFAAMLLSEKYGIDMPITREIYSILKEGKDPRAAVIDLMTREQKNE